MACEMRTMSCGTTRPAPRFRWPTSLLPICPSGSPTASHDAARAEVQVAHLAVADLSFGKSDGEPRRVEERARRATPQAMPDGRRAEFDGVAHPAGTEAPAAEHDQDARGARPLPVCHIGGDAI